jgi:hypothetical protein
MRRAKGKWLLALGIVLTWMPSCFAQTPGPVAGLLGLFPARAWTGHDGADSANSLEDRNGDLLVGNPLLDGVNAARLGWFTTVVDADILASHVHSQLNAPVAVGTRLDTIALPSANLNWSVAPRFELGYRCGQGLGEFILAYRFVATDGSATIPKFDSAGNTGALQSRFSMNVIDLDYASQENSLVPTWDMRWHIGARVAGLYFDSQATSPLLQQHVSNDFWGGGPHVSLELWRPIVERRVGFNFRIDGAGVFGNVQQGFAETIGGVSGFTRQTQLMPTTMLNVEAGLTWTPTECLRLSGGYTYEHWWDATYAGNSRGDIWTQGVFLRAEWRY